MSATQSQIEEATSVVAYYTVAASVTGAIPVPASSGAIIAENAAMIGHVAAKLGQEITWEKIVGSMGLTATLNVAGRALFIEGAKLLSWGTGSIWAMIGLSAFGASTAGLQTYIIGMLAIEIGKNGGEPLDTDTASKVAEDCKKSYDSFSEEWKKKGTQKPE